MGKIWNFEDFNDSIALVDDKGNSVTYSQILAEEKKLEASNKNQPLVMLLCRNSMGAIFSYIAYLNSGAHLMMVSAELPLSMRNGILKAYKPDYILLPEEEKKEYEHMSEEAKYYDYCLLKTNYVDHYPVNPDLGLLITTSGSTGSVKFVRQSFENVRNNAKVYVKFMEVDSSERTITALPLQYAYGLCNINSTLMAGGRIAITQKSVVEADFWDFFDEMEITSFHGVPNVYEMLCHIGIFEEDMPTLKFFTASGGKLSNEMQKYYAEYAKKYKKRFLLIYGQTETTGVISYLAGQDALNKPGSAGKALQGTKLYLEDENGKEITEIDKAGELCFEGPNVTMGYAECGQHLLKGDEWKGKLKTGDVGHIDKDGFFFITGRLKRFIKMFGHRTSLDEIDEKIMDALHIATVSSGTDNNLVIFVLKESDKAAVSEFIRKNIPAVKANFKVSVIEEFPRSESGKIKFGELLEIAKKL